ncbi:hypothetical protein [Litorihabitans aurantiacus]|uniref:hypothetical protein n=1 Tax=Litorihabitans aurantiacus TaxID=1930061 RepID=UPI0024E11215|nr:hypothetical protein [Litorihabitans aurantiacus]
MPRPPALVERVELEPRVVGRETGRPQHGADTGAAQVERAHGLRHAGGLRTEVVRLGLEREVEAVALDVGVGVLEHPQVGGVTGGDRGAQVVVEVHDAVADGGGAAHQRDALGGEVAEVDGPAAVGPADRDRDVLRAQRRSARVPLAQHAEPPHEVAPAVAARRPVVRSDGEVNLAPGPADLLRDLDAGGTGTHDEDPAGRELVGVAVVARVQLEEVGVGRDERGTAGFWNAPVAATT